MTSKIESLYQPIGGLLTYPNNALQSPGDPKYYIYSSSLGNLQFVNLFKNRNFGFPMQMEGAGGDIYSDSAQLKCLAEALERYSSCAYTKSQFTYAKANELGEDALDLDTIPIVSDLELQHPKCPIIRPDKNKEIRWIKGFSLTKNKPLYVPAIMTYLYIPYLSDAERFWLPISTGCAIHTNYTKALINGINEVIERDAIALTWLNKLELPRLDIDIDTLPSWCKDYYLPTEKHPFIKTYYFDATTDIGIPTIYSLQVSSYNEKVSSLVMCSTELDPMLALSKITREAASLRIGLQNQELKKQDPDMFHHVSDGALYMAKKSKMSAFNFLRNTPNKKRLSEMQNQDANSDDKNLKTLIRALKEKGHEIVAVDITSDEAERVGFKAVRVIVPTLQPLSFSYRAQFKGSKRLYEGPVKMGYDVCKENELNRNPQPFA